MALLATLQQAKDHLRITTSDGDTDILLKLETASAFVVTHLKAQADVTWTASTVPKPIQAAVLCVLEDLYEHREINGELVDRLLIPHRDPTLA